MRVYFLTNETTTPAAIAFIPGRVPSKKRYKDHGDGRKCPYPHQEGEARSFPIPDLHKRTPEYFLVLLNPTVDDMIFYYGEKWKERQIQIIKTDSGFYMVSDDNLMESPDDQAALFGIPIEDYRYHNWDSGNIFLSEDHQDDVDVKREVEKDLFLHRLFGEYEVRIFPTTAPWPALGGDDPL